MVGQIFADQIEVTIRHHALESGCFVVNATGWLTDEQIKSITPGRQASQGAAGRLSYRDYLAGRRAIVRASDGRRRHGHRGAGPRADYETQKNDGFRRVITQARHLHAAH